MRLVLGVDVGQSTDPTALILLGSEDRQHRLGWAETLPSVASAKGNTSATFSSFQVQAAS